MLRLPGRLSDSAKSELDKSKFYATQNNDLLPIKSVMNLYKKWWSSWIIWTKFSPKSNTQIDQVSIGPFEYFITNIFNSSSNLSFFLSEWIHAHQLAGADPGRSEGGEGVTESSYFAQEKKIRVYLFTYILQKG